MNWDKISKLSNEKNIDGTTFFKKSSLSNIIKKIKQGNDNLINIAANVISAITWIEMFTPEYKINQEYLEQNPDVNEAFKTAYPNVNPSEVLFDNQVQAQGMINGVKGKLFEIKVTEKLNEGDRVGDFQLEEGQQAQLTESNTQEGIDIEIVNEDGTVVDYYQLKATDNIGYLKSEITSNSDYDYVTTSEVADADIDVTNIYNSGISNSSLEEVLYDMFEMTLDQIPELLGINLAASTVPDLYKLFKGNITIGNLYKRFIKRAKVRIPAAIGGKMIASLLIATGAGPITILVGGLLGAICTSILIKKYGQSIKNRIKQTKLYIYIEKLFNKLKKSWIVNWWPFNTIKKGLQIINSYLNPDYIFRKALLWKYKIDVKKYEVLI